MSDGTSQSQAGQSNCGRCGRTNRDGGLLCAGCRTLSDQAAQQHREGTTKEQRDAHMPRDRLLATGRERTMG